VNAPGHSATCPSAPARPGAVLLGILGPNGRVVYTPGGPRATAGLLGDVARTMKGPVETRYRFAGPCVTNGCAYWDGRCRAIDAAHADLDATTAGEAGFKLPECGIRETCRWWAQEGQQACRVCIYVATASPTAA
jgi:hypothetical protein